MKNELLKHIIATIDYRFQKAIIDSSNHFGDFKLGKGSRSPKEIVNHMYHVLFFTRKFIETEKQGQIKPGQLTLKKEVERFNEELKNIDQLLSKENLDIEYSKKLIQGPLSDIFTHIGQIAMMQRLDDKPIPKEDFSSADINTGLK